MERYVRDKSCITARNRGSRKASVQKLYKIDCTSEQIASFTRPDFIEAYRNLAQLSDLLQGMEVTISSNYKQEDVVKDNEMVKGKHYLEVARGYTDYGKNHYVHFVALTEKEHRAIEAMKSKIGEFAEKFKELECKYVPNVAGSGLDSVHVFDEVSARLYEQNLELPWTFSGKGVGTPQEQSRIPNR